MSLANYIPGVAHVKAGIHLLCNDKEGAERTLETCNTKAPILAHHNALTAKFAGDDEYAQKCWEGGNNSLNAIPVVGHAKGMVHYSKGEVEAGDQAMEAATATTMEIADGIPGIGHAKGLVHYSKGEYDEGNKAMLAATRTTVVMGAGAGGFYVAGPAGAVVGGVAAGACWDGVTYKLTDGKEVRGVFKAIENPNSVDAYFDAGFSLLGDGFAGYSGGKIVETCIGSNNSSTAVSSTANREALNAASEQMGNDFLEGRISYPELHQKYGAIKPKEVPSIKVSAEQLESYFSKGFITGPQYNQAIGEMAKTGSKLTEVIIPSSTDRLINSNYGNNKDCKKLMTGGEAIKAAAAHQKLVDDFDAGNISFNEYKQKWNASMKPKDIPVKVNQEQLLPIKELQYHQAMKEISHRGTNKATVATAPSRGRHSTSTNDYHIDDDQKKVKQSRGNNDRRDNQPPQQPSHFNTTNSTDTEDPLLRELRRKLLKLLDRIRQRIEQDRRTSRQHWSQEDRQFQREAFREFHQIVTGLISYGHFVLLPHPSQSYPTVEENHLFISSPDGRSWVLEIEYQIADYLDVHHQLINQRFDFNPIYNGRSMNDTSPCPMVLSANFQGSKLVLTHQADHSSHEGIIYGIRCQICQRGSTMANGNINYVGQTKRSLHQRVCKEHARSIANIKGKQRPMYEHAQEHLKKLPWVPPQNAFQQVMEVIILPINGGPDDLRSWECFWQFFFHCRTFFWGWSQR